MPEGLEIDRSANMNGVMASYAEHVLICTGKDDWTSRIEDDESGDNLAADLKELIGRGGVYSDVSFEFALFFGVSAAAEDGRTDGRVLMGVDADAPARGSRSTTSRC